MDFFSARLLYIVLVDDGRSRKRNLHDSSVVVFRAREFEDAFEKALEIGKAKECEYENELGQNVRWALVSVENLDWVGQTVNKKEVASALHYRVSKQPISPKRASSAIQSMFSTRRHT